MCFFFGGPKLFSMTVTYAIGRKGILPSGPFFSLWVKTSQLSCLQKSVSPKFHVEFQWIFMPDVSLHFLFPHFICLCYRCRGGWLFEEWLNWEFSADPLDKSRYAHTVESGHIPGLIINEIIAPVETVGNYGSVLSRDYINYDWWIWVYSLLQPGLIQESSLGRNMHQSSWHWLGTESK